MPTGSKNRKSRFVGLRLPHELDEQVKQVATESGRAYSQIVIEAIRQFLQKEGEEA